MLRASVHVGNTAIGTYQESVFVSDSQKYRYDSRSMLKIRPVGKVAINGRLVFDKNNDSDIKPGLLSDVYVSIAPLIRGSADPEATTNTFQKDGTFTLRAFPGEESRFVVDLPATLVLTNILYNGQVVKNPRRFQLDNSAPSHVIELNISVHPATISGTVNGDLKQTPASVILFKPTSLDPDCEYFERVEAVKLNGRFTIQGLAPGDYLITAIPQTTLSARAAVGVLERLMAQAQKINLSSSSQEVTLNVKR